jgi:hypothetical protein
VIGGEAAGGVRRVAGIITISKGHDAAYPWKQIGTENGSTGKAGHATASRSGIGYYLSPAERGGEPPGTWTGKDVAELCLEPGGIVDRKLFEPLYGQHADPRDPAGEPHRAGHRAGTRPPRRSTRACSRRSRTLPPSGATSS